MMLPLEIRSNRLLSIHIRSIGLEYTKYSLKIIVDDNEYVSVETEKTMLPKFDLDRNNKEISNILMNSNNSNFIFILIKNKSELIEKFGVEISDLIFICDDLAKARIKSYPIIIFEFMEGFYTTRDFYINNTFNYELEAFGNSMSKFNKKMNFNYSSNFKREIKFSTYNEKFKQYEFFDKQSSILKQDTEDKIRILNNQINIIKGEYQKYFIRYEKMTNISNIRKKNIVIDEKIGTLEMNIDILRKVISQKQNDLRISSSIFNFNKETYINKIQEVEKNNKKLEKYKIIFNSLRNKKLTEITYTFLNNFCSRFYIIPGFYHLKFDTNNKIMRYQFYENNSKELSVMMGVIAKLLNYISKIFNVTLKYPLFINGSLSFIVKDKKDFIPLYSNTKTEDRLLKFETATWFLLENLYEVLKYLNITYDKCNIFSNFLLLAKYLSDHVSKKTF